jgi:ATP-dependent Clp protease adaptor protein ClpS
MIFEPDIEQELDVLIKEVTAKTKVIILYNDDYNTFDHVINCLLKYCDHNPIQAEQCALLVHHNGKCDVKHGSYDKLKPICEALLEQGLTAKIED